MRQPFYARSLLVLVLSGVCGCASIGENTDVVQIDMSGDRQRAAKLNQSGAHHYEHGHLKKAEVAFTEAIAADESYGPAHNNLGLLYYDQRNLYQAAWSFQRAMELMPESGEPANNLGLTYEAAGNLGQALEAYYLATEMAPTNAEFLGNLARARIRQGDRDDMLRFQLQQLIFLDTRPEWIKWAEDFLVLGFGSGNSDDSQLEINSPQNSPEVVPTPESEQWSISDLPPGADVVPVEDYLRAPQLAPTPPR